MPLHDIKCNACGKIYEDFDLMGPQVTQMCVCGNKSFTKIPAAPALRFKGDGFQTPSPKGNEE
jgi:predicted nucleic acid-binding Zn ribbon protein